MKCENPECPNPSFVESLTVKDLKFCPICGSPLEPALKSSENNEKREEARQTEEERPAQSSIKPNKNGTTVPEGRSSSLLEPQDRGEEMVESAAGADGDGRQGQADLNDSNTSGTVTISEKSDIGDDHTRNQASSTFNVGLEGAYRPGSVDGDGKQGQASGGPGIADDHTRNQASSTFNVGLEGAYRPGSVDGDGKQGQASGGPGIADDHTRNQASSTFNVGLEGAYRPGSVDGDGKQGQASGGPGIADDHTRNQASSTFNVGLEGAYRPGSVDGDGKQGQASGGPGIADDHTRNQASSTFNVGLEGAYRPGSVDGDGKQGQASGGPGIADDHTRNQASSTFNVGLEGAYRPGSVDGDGKQGQASGGPGIADDHTRNQASSTFNVGLEGAYRPGSVDGDGKQGQASGGPGVADDHTRNQASSTTSSRWKGACDRPGSTNTGSENQDQTMSDDTRGETNEQLKDNTNQQSASASTKVIEDKVKPEDKEKKSVVTKTVIMVNNVNGIKKKEGIWDFNSDGNGEANNSKAKDNIETKEGTQVSSHSPGGKDVGDTNQHDNDVPAQHVASASTTTSSTNGGQNPDQPAESSSLNNKTNKAEGTPSPSENKNEPRKATTSISKSSGSISNESSQQGGYFYQKPPLDEKVANKEKGKNAGSSANKATQQQQQQEKQKLLEQQQQQQQQQSSQATSNESGDSGAPENITIVFHALLAPHFMFNPSYGERIFVCGSFPFKGWNENQLEMTPKRWLQNGYILIEGETQIPYKCAYHRITYKYIVFKPYEAGRKYIWEELVGYPNHYGMHTNRCFYIHERSRKPRGIWHQYDDGVFRSLGTMESFLNRFPMYKSDVNPVEGRQLAMQVMLPDWDSFGEENRAGKKKGSEVLEKINQVVYCIENLKRETGGQVYAFELKGFSLEQVMLSYIEPRLNLNYDIAQANNDVEEQAKRLATSLAIAAIASNFVTRLDFRPEDDQLATIFECLAISPSLDQQRLERVLEILIDGYYSPEKTWRLIEGILELCQFTVTYRPHIHHWLLAVPLIHFLSKSSQPYEEVNLAPLPEISSRDDSYWGTNGLHLYNVQAHSNSSPIEVLYRLKPMFEFDPLLRRTFLFALPLRDLGSCISNGDFPPDEICWTLCVRLQKTSFIGDEVISSIDECLCAVIKTIDREPEAESEADNLIIGLGYDKLMSLAKASQQVLDFLLKEKVTLACTVLTVLAKTLSLLKYKAAKPKPDEQDATNHDNIDDFCSKSFIATTKKVRNFLEKRFTGNLGYHSGNSVDEELKMWSDFYRVDFSDNDFRLSWEEGLKQNLNFRVKKMDNMQRIDFYSKVKFSHLHKQVEECFQEAAFDAITSIIKGGRGTDHSKAFDSLSKHDPNSSQSRRVGEMMSLLLKRCWAEDTDQEDGLLTHILTWSPMANYLRYFSKSSQTLWEDSQVLLTRTRSCLENIHRAVSDGSVTVETLRILRDKEAKYCELLDIMGDSIDDDDDDDSDDDDSDDDDSASKGWGRIYKKAKATLQKRLDELTAFEDEREQIHSFLGISSILQHVDVDKMKAKANCDVSQEAISDLAVHVVGDRDGQTLVQVTFFGLSRELKTMITTMHRIHNSRIFKDIWRKKFQNAQQDDQFMTLEEVVQQVWSPTFRKCTDILRAVLSGNITLGDIDKRFEDFKDSEADLEQELCIIMDACGITADDDRVHTQVNQIQQYHRLTNCTAAAEKILEFADNMGLDHGDFGMVDTFLLQISAESKKQPLKYLREEFSQAGRMLEEFTPVRLKCLDVVMKSKDFIVWLKENVPEPSEITVLVDLAMMSAGEGDLETDRIAALHTCARGFKPLIYDLHKDAGFEKLVEFCHEVWNALEDNPRLPEQMTDTSRRLEWLKNVLEFHGSVIMSSLRQVETIIQHGTLTVGCHGKSDEIDLDTVVSVNVPRNEIKGLQKENYNLEELKDLQSKLMLIAGTSAGQDHVEKFTEMLQGALSLGTVYTNLCETGEVSHLDWKKQFNCHAKYVAKDLQDDCNQLDEILKAWMAILNCQRLKCKELNYFTARQLLYMRKEIAELRRGRDFTSLGVQLYTLLDSVLPGLNARSLQEALIAIDIDVDLPEEEQPSMETAVEKNIADDDLRKRYEKFFNHIEELGFPEEFAVAAIVACDCSPDESELLMWSLRHNQDEDAIREVCEEGSQNPTYASLFPQESVTEGEQDDDEEEMDLDRPAIDDDRNIAAELDQTLGGLYLSLEELSTLLGCLANNSTQEKQRQMTFPDYLTAGKPNLLLVPQRDILPTVLGLYMESKGLPSRHEVLICTKDTTLEEVELLWRRVLTNTSDKFYCLVNVDRLNYSASQQAVQNFFNLAHREYPDSDDFKVVVICSSEQEVKSPIVSALDEYRVTGAPRCPRPAEVTEYLQKEFVAPRPQPVEYQGHYIDWVPAAQLESQNRLSVRVISSDRAGTGKSLIVQDYSERLDSITSNGTVTQLLEEQGEHVTSYVIVPLHGKTVNLSDTVGVLLPYSLKTNVPMSRIFHIDVSPSVEHGLDTLLFNLLLLGSIQDNRGRVWKRNPRDLYIIEVTSSHAEGTDKYERSRSQFYHELPHVTCVTPTKALQQMNQDTAPDSCITSFNEGQFQSEPVQRVYQYLQLYDTAPEMLHEFRFDPEVLSEGGANCLCLLMKYCGVTDPSWAELRHFVDFLNYQLTDCEQSVFCRMENIEDTLEGFRLFVVRFMTLMAQDFSTRSLSDRSDDDNTGNDDETQDIVQFQLRRKWENSPHPYMFFNPDHQTFTFLGFRLDPDGNLINSSTGEMIQEHLMTRHLRTGLYVQKVNFDEDFEQLNKGDKIEKICAVLGVEWPRDPDESYELTEDNAKKMLAIHMRFRCGIPVVVMGETGCGKTKLIRYLCGLQKGFDERKNMLLVKVHGGTTFHDIEKKVKQAQQMAKENSKNNVETILFFDEVNTTEALDLVKEIMVDRRLNGRPLGSEDDGLRFIAACNPYRKHTETMIKKLESAGLGYSVKTGNATERIGCVPLRHLVYRVHALPDSMRFLIWDFGQLNPEVEQLYTRQIVLRHVITENRIPGDETLVDAITAVLAASQQYMRKQADECSFVSLRDVERTMNVMVWFYEHKDVFRPLLEDIANEEDNSTDGRRSDEEEEEEEKEKEMNAVEDSVDEDDDESGSDGREKEKESDNEEETTTRQQPKNWRGFLSADFKRSAVRQQQEAAESGSGLSMPSPFAASVDEGHFVPVAPYDDDTYVQEPVFIFEEEDLDDPSKPLDPVTWSLILAIGVCYHAKLQERKQYRQDISKTFRRPCLLYGGANRILQEITRCQKAVLQELNLGENIARNTALSENVFMMLVCIELRIPLFVIGKPGSSKSLAKTVVADNMQGDASKSKLFKSFKEVQMSSHQCSPLSRPEGIQETFRQCANIQKDKNPDKFVSVVVLDEVGLAEDSPLMPLKTLHPLLEDGVTSSDDIIETDEKPTRVAFIGISNWALDPAKMNRGIMLSRDVPDEGELRDSAMGICASNKEVQELMEPIIPALAAAYSEIYEQQREINILKTANKDEFFGLRDFYSLIKMLRVIAEKRERVPDWRDVEYAVRRNFGGLDVKELNPVKIFMRHFDVEEHVRMLQEEQEHQARHVSTLHLIKSSLEKDSSEENSRYLLILTENHAALGIVEQHLKQLQEQRTEDLDAVLIFGSSFPKDLEYTQVCRNINEIKVCMEAGRTVILLNMEKLYEGLYDALNQYYVEFVGNRYVDLGLGTHRVKCRVHKNFRLIVIAEKKTVYEKFPIPLINRLEKHFLVWSTSLTEPQEKLVAILRRWIERFSSITIPAYRGSKKKFTEDDAFVGFHEDTIPSVVLQVCSQLQQDGTTVDDEMKDQWEEEVLQECKSRLVQCCPPDAIFRLHYSKLQHEADQLWDLYFKEQKHSSLASFVSSVDRRYHRDGLLIQVSTHSKLLSEQNLNEIGEALHLHHQAVSCITLQQFQTEQQFCDSVGTFFAKQGGQECLLIIQCNTEDLTFNLLACARHHLLKQRSKITDEIPDAQPTHIIVIIQLPKMLGKYPDFVGFQGQQWESVHIDELFSPSFYVPSLETVKDHSLSDLFEESIAMCLTKTDREEQVLDAVDVLRQSVQAAAGRIEDGPETVARATKRIVILLSLLSKDRSEALDENSFPHVLLRRVHQLMKEKDATAPHEGSRWSTLEALESSELQENGTYRKALWRRIQNAVVPILSEVITYIDKDGNLELLHSGMPWIKELWLKLFADDKLAQLHYDFFLTNDDDRRLKNHVRVTSSGRDSHWFQCQLPFSWLLKENIDSMWFRAKNVSENSNEPIQDCFQRFVVRSDIAEEIIVMEEKQEAMERYIHDFVHMNYKPVVPREDELIVRALVVEARHLHALSHSYGNEFKSPDIALVHKAYSHIKDRIACFSQLVQCIPGIVPQLLNKFTPDESEMILDVMALQICLESLEPVERSFKDSNERRQWCDEVIAVRATAKRIFAEKLEELEDEEKRMRIISCCRPLWERLTAIRLFIEHVYLSKKKGRKGPENIIKLCKVLDDKTCFSSANSIEAVELFLLECIASFKKSSSQTALDFRHHCNSFFMELISLLCFCGDAHRKSLESEVFEIFMRYITGSSSSQATKNFSPFPDFEEDTTPVVRSFLLQQLLTISFDESKKYLQQYLSSAWSLSQDRHHVMRVCQLVVDCIEDSISSTFAQREVPTSILIGLATGMISKGIVALQRARYSVKLDIEVLETIARVRHALALTAEFVFKTRVTSDANLQEPEVRRELDKLLAVVKGICEEMPDRAPLVYLLKQLTRRYGASVIKDLTQDPEMAWLIPREFQERQMDTLDADRFVVHNKEYTNVRDALARGLLSGNVDELCIATQMDSSEMTSSKTKMDVLCLLSIYREITCGYRKPRHQLQALKGRGLCCVISSARPAFILCDGMQENNITNEEYDELRKFFDELLSPEARPLVVELLNNSHGMGFTALSVQPAQPRETINLAELVVHTMVVLQCSNDNEFVRTLRALLMNPGSMKDSFLPTMPEDDFQHVRTGLKEPVKWYVCPQGHRYSIGDCGNANQESICPECKQGIGGAGYKLLPGNAPLTDQNEDRSNRGHILGNANTNPTSSAAQPERNLSPAVVHIIRLVMHSAMLVGACRHPQESSQIFSPPVEPEKLNQFLWAHLTRDLRCLAAALNRNEDEALLTVHLVLSQMTRVSIHDDSLFQFPGTGVLNSSRARRQWEEDFTSRFIEPVVSCLDEHLQTCFDVMTSDSRVGTDPLMREIYEVDSLDTEQEEEGEDEVLSPMDRCFWRYRPIITIEHVKQRFSEKMKSDKTIQQCKVLQSFFKEEYRLRVVCYLPNINKLHKLLTERLYQRINPKQAAEMKVKEFEAKLKNSEKKEFKALFGSFKAAWTMVREHLDKQGRYKLSSEQCRMTIDDNSPMSVLIPSSDGLGRCSLALVFYLVTAHNEFMETYFNIIMGKARQDNKIRLQEVTPPQLVSYHADRDLLPLLQAHCHYSLEVGCGTLAEYDWSAIQRQLIDRFIQGKMLVEFEEPKFVFLRSNDEEMFADVRTKIEQENISPTSARMITRELRQLHEVCEVKLSLEIAIGFLASSGGQSELLISEYLHDTLCMPKEKGLRSHRAEHYCQLKHIIHLWQLVTIQRAKILLQQGQDPFEEVQECFKEEIPRSKLIHLNKFLSKIDCRRFCAELLEMIVFSLNEENEKHVETSLQEFFEYHMDDRDATDVSTLPAELLLKHAVSTWQNVLEKSEQNLSSRH